jgi:hypothetical protein
MPLEYLTYFQPYVTGVLYYGSLTDLLDVQVCFFLIWFNAICSFTDFFLLLLSRWANLRGGGA